MSNLMKQIYYETTSSYPCNWDDIYPCNKNAKSLSRIVRWWYGLPSFTIETVKACDFDNLLYGVMLKESEAYFKTQASFYKMKCDLPNGATEHTKDRHGFHNITMDVPILTLEIVQRVISDVLGKSIVLLD